MITSHIFFFRNSAYFGGLGAKKTNIYILYRVIKEKGVEEDFAYSYVYRSTFLNKKESIQINTTKFNTKCLQNQPF